MKLHKLLTIFLFAAFSVISAQTINLSSEKTGITVISQNQNELTLKFNIQQLRYFEVETKEGVFTQFVIPGFHHSHTVGKPNLPMMNKIIEIPIGATVKTEIVAYDEKVIDLTKLGVENKLMPMQPSLSKSQDPQSVPFRFDAAAYVTDEFFSEATASVKVLGIMRDKRLALLKIAPVQYNPVENKLKVLENLEVKVTFENADYFATERMHEIYYSPDFSQSMKNMIALETKDDPQSLIRFPQKYIVVMPNSFAETMAPFIAWKKQQGFDVILYTFDGVANNNEVKQFIHDLYNNATEDDPAPTYVLFAGDTEQIPPFNGTTGGHVTDLPFVDVTGDNLPDIYTARFSARNIDELQPYVDKTLYYEKFEIADPSYLNNITLIAGWDASHAETHGYPTIRYGHDYYYNAAHGFNTNMYETTGSGQFENEIISDVNNGVAFINYTAHGSQTSWADPSMTLSDVHGFTNDGKYTLAIGNACLTASMEVGECFGEAWLRKANGGGIGYIGGTNSTYWDEDVFWSTGYFDHVGDGVTPTLEETTMGAYDAGFVTDDLTTQVAMIYVGNFAVMTSGSSRDTYYWEIYQLFGDPSLMIYWGAPEEMTVEHMPVLLLGSSTFEIMTDAPKALIGLMKDGELVASAMTDETGYALVDFGAPLTVAGEYTLTITAQNKIPHVETIQAIVPANVTLTPSSVNIATATDVVVSVSDTSNAPMANVNIWISSPGYFVDTVVTNSNGEATLSVNAPFGPYLVIYGKRPADSYLLFKDTLEVTGASDFTDADLTVTTTFGLTDEFNLNLPGTIHGVPSTATVYVAEENSYLTVNADTMLYTPLSTGEVRAFVVQNGYNFYTETFPVVKATATLTGHVYDASGNPISGAVVRGYSIDDGSEIFNVTTNYNGEYDANKQIGLGEIILEALAFGYETSQQIYFVEYPSNEVDITLSSAPSSYITGYVKNEDGDPLDATVKIYRFDTGELYKTLTASANNGGYFADSLVNFDFNVKVKSSGYKQLDTLLTVSEDAVWNFTLELPSGILILANDTKGYYADKECTIPLKDLSGIKLSSNEIYDTLQAWGLNVTKEDAAASDFTTWPNYSGIIFAQGAASGVMPTAMQQNIIDYVDNGGVILIEGGELGYSNRDEPIAGAVLHVNGWGHDNSGNIVVKQQRHPIWRSPNSLPNILTHNYNEWGDEDSMEPTDTTEVVSVWSDYGNLSSVIAYNSQVVYFSFNFASIADASLKGKLLENALNYLDMFPPVDVEENGETEIPAKFELMQNYPNPFNPTSTIAFAIPKNARVNLSVYNVLGQKVAELINGVQSAGYHSVTWDAGNFASGIYIYRIKAEAIDGSSTFTATRKMVLLK